MLHLYGKIARRAPVSSLLETMLLRLHPTLVDRAAIAVSALPGIPASSRAGELPVGGGSDPTVGLFAGRFSDFYKSRGWRP